MGIVGLGLASDPDWRPADLHFDLIETMPSVSPAGVGHFLTIALSLLGNRRRQVALVHLNVSINGSTVRKMLLGLICRVRRIPYVIHIHSGNYGSFYASRSTRSRRRITRFMQRADRVIVLGEQMRQMALDTIGLEPDRVAVVPNAVIDPGPVVTTSGKPVTVLHHGRLSDEKGTFDLLHALARLDRGLPWQAVVAGDGATGEVREFVSRSGLADRVRVCNWLDRDAAIDEIVRADIYALPSHSEGLSLSLLEAMAAGLACITTPVGAHVDVVDSGRCGVIVPVGDDGALAEALRELIEDPGLRARLGRAARERFLVHYEITRLRQQLADLYRDVLEGPAPI